MKVEREGGEKKAVVANPRRDTCSREVLRHEASGGTGFGRRGFCQFSKYWLQLCHDCKSMITNTLMIFDCWLFFII